MQSQFPMFRDFIPEKLRFWIILVFPFIYQSSNPLYMNIASQMMSDTALTNEDIMFCGFACILGITVTFPILFRLKFRFTTRKIILFASIGIILCNIVALYCRFMPLLVFVCFVFGIFKVWGTFECMSSMMQKITPKMELAPFLTVVFIAVFSGVELGGLASTYISFYYSWSYVSYFVIGLHLMIILIALIAMQNFSFRQPMKLYGIDWLGLVLWGIFLLALTFVCIYGEYLEWFSSPYTSIAIGISFLALAINLWRMTHIRHPFIELQCFRYRNIWNIMVIFFISGIMLSSQNVLQNIYTEEVLNFDSLNAVSLNWFILIGIIFGAVFCNYAFLHLGWGYKQLTFLSILITTFYVAGLYFLISPQTNIEAFYLPSFLSGVGHSMLFVILTTYVESSTPFIHRFQMLTVLGLIRTGIATPIGNAVYKHLFGIEMKRNLSLLGSNVNFDMLQQTPQFVVTDSLVMQALLISLQNLFGVAVLIGIVTMLIILLSRFKEQRYRTITTLVRMYKISLQRSK